MSLGVIFNTKGAKMAYPAKKARNRGIFQKRQKGWSFRKIADYYNINVKTVFEIYEREAVGSYPQKTLDSVGA